MDSSAWVSSLLGGLLLITFLPAVISEVVASYRVQKATQHPLVGGSRLFPRFVLNLRYAMRARQLLEKGYYQVCHE